MSKHTPTPWIRDVDNWLSICDIEAHSFPFDDLICQVNGKDRPEADANRVRIVACVNAFHSEDGREMPTERIEPGMVWALWDAAKDFHEAMSLNPSITAAMYGPDFDLDKRRRNCAEALAALLDKMEG